MRYKALWYENGDSPNEIEQFDSFYRKVRRSFNKLEEAGYIVKKPSTRGYILRRDYLQSHLF